MFGFLVLANCLYAFSSAARKYFLPPIRVKV